MGQRGRKGEKGRGEREERREKSEKRREKVENRRDGRFSSFVKLRFSGDAVAREFERKLLQCRENAQKRGVKICQIGENARFVLQFAFTSDIIILLRCFKDFERLNNSKRRIFV